MALNANLNYASAYMMELQEAYKTGLMFGDLYSAPDNTKFRFLNESTIEMPTISTSGRTDSDRSGDYTQGSYSNSWIPRKLENERQWNIKVHPRDIQETNGVSGLSNLIKNHNEFHKFPEMDSYTVSKAFYEWETVNGKTPITTPLTVDNVLQVIDDMVLQMDEARVPATGRILYVTHYVANLINNASSLNRNIDVQSSSDAVNRTINRLDELIIKKIPMSLMKTDYDFTVGAEPVAEARQINMWLIHPSAVVTPVTYSFAQLDAPSAGSHGLYEYFEESHEDLFLLPYKEVALLFHVDPSPTGVTKGGK